MTNDAVISNEGRNRLRLKSGEVRHSNDFQLQGKITQSQEDAYLRDMILDARKCAQEKPGTAVIIGLSHGPRPDKAGMERIYSEIQAEFSKYNPNGKILVFLTNSKDDFGDF